jgi:hypothetical protein
MSPPSTSTISTTEMGDGGNEADAGERGKLAQEQIQDSFAAAGRAGVTHRIELLVAERGSLRARTGLVHSRRGALRPAPRPHHAAVSRRAFSGFVPS